MDVNHLVPTPAPQNPGGVAAPRTRQERALFEASPLPATTPVEAPESPRPIAPAGATGDRIERSPDLEQTIGELRHDLAQLPEPAPERLLGLRAALASTALATPEAFESAAENLLRGEPSFSA